MKRKFGLTNIFLRKKLEKFHTNLAHTTLIYNELFIMITYVVTYFLT